MTQLAAPRTPDTGTVATLLARHTRLVPKQIMPQGGGLSSHAFCVHTTRDRFIIRLGEGPDKLAGFERERRAVGRARMAGIPTQEIVTLGEDEGWVYTIAHRLPGESAVDHPERLAVLENVGRLARIVHSIATAGHGQDFVFCEDTTEPKPSHASRQSWFGFLRDELDARGRLQQLHEGDMLSDRQLETLSAMLTDVESWDAAPVLNHGDLRLKNVVVDATGDILGLIDWETAVSSIGPHWDLSVGLHDLAIDAKQAFLNGYGMPEEDVRRAVPVWRLFNVLNYAPTVDRLVTCGDQQGLEHVRTRLRGGLDLFAVSDA